MSVPFGTDGPSRLSVIRTVHDDVTVISMQGEIDLYTAPRLRQVLTADRAGHPAHVVIDFKWVDFMDSSGLNALLALRRAAQEVSGWVRLAGMQPSVRRVLEFSGLTAVFDCYPTVHRALTV